MKQITSYEGACKVLKLNPKDLPIVKNLPKKHQKALVAHYKLIIIAQALNDGWNPNWNDHNEWKYYPWFYIKASKTKPSGFGFSHTDYDGTRATTTVGSRLCFKTSTLAEYAGKKFKKLYQEYMLM